MAEDSGRFSRRRFLSSAGVTVTLPMLPSLLWSRRSGLEDCFTEALFQQRKDVIEALL